MSIQTRRRIDTPSAPARRQPRRVRALLLALGFVVGLAAGWIGATLSRSVARPAPTPAALPGPKSVEAGVPVGYPDTRAGARAAAANFVAALNGAPSRDLSNRQTLVDAIAAPQERADLAAQLAGNDRVFEEAFALSKGGNSMFLATPLSEKVLSWSPSSALVDVYGLTIVGREAIPLATSYYGIEHLTLGWVGGDWKLLSRTTTTGPTPSSQPPDGDPNSLLSGFGSGFFSGSRAVTQRLPSRLPVLI